MNRSMTTIGAAFAAVIGFAVVTQFANGQTEVPASVVTIQNSTSGDLQSAWDADEVCQAPCGGGLPHTGTEGEHACFSGSPTDSIIECLLADAIPYQSLQEFDGRLQDTILAREYSDWSHQFLEFGQRADLTLNYEFPDQDATGKGRPQLVGTFTSAEVDAGNDTITINGHGLIDGRLVTFRKGATGNLPGNIKQNQHLWVADATANTFKLSGTPEQATAPGGFRLDIANTGGAGPHEVTVYLFDQLNLMNLGAPVTGSFAQDGYLTIFPGACPIAGACPGAVASIQLSMTGNSIPVSRLTCTGASSPQGCCTGAQSGYCPNTVRTSQMFTWRMADPDEHPGLPPHYEGRTTPPNDNWIWVHETRIRFDEDQQGIAGFGFTSMVPGSDETTIDLLESDGTMIDPSTLNQSFLYWELPTPGPGGNVCNPYTFHVYRNPVSLNGQCTGAGAPFACCTDVGLGDCGHDSFTGTDTADPYDFCNVNNQWRNLAFVMIADADGQLGGGQPNPESGRIKLYIDGKLVHTMEASVDNQIIGCGGQGCLPFWWTSKTVEIVPTGTMVLVADWHRNLITREFQTRNIQGTN